MINYESPVFVSIVLYTIYALLLLAVVLMVWSAVRGMRMLDRHAGRQNGVPQRKIALLTAGGLLLLMGAAWLLSSTKPIQVNGKVFADAFWLRTSGMLIVTPIVLIAIIAVLMIVAEIMRRKHHV